MTCQLTNVEVLCFVLGWQGGTVHQVADELGVKVDEVLRADHKQMHHWCRMAQHIRKQREREGGVTQ